MKILLFTHKIDIDGMGCAVLAKLAFENVEIVYCDTFEINQQIQKYIDNNSIDDFDKIFVTDLCIKKPLIDYFDNNKELSNKTCILDHHKSELEEGNGDYTFSHILISNDKGKCSGTSLFYEYLLDNNLINANEELDMFVELTRQYDTWEWKTIYNNEQANELNITFSILGLEKYVYEMYNKLKNNEEIFDKTLKNEILKYKQHILNKCSEYVKSIEIVKIKNLNVGVIEKVEDQYRNDIAEFIRNNLAFNIDLVALIICGRDTISLRSIKSGVDVGEFAINYGGKGHKEAASCPQNNKILNDLNVI